MEVVSAIRTSSAVSEGISNRVYYQLTWPTVDNRLEPQKPKEHIIKACGPKWLKCCRSARLG